MLVLNENKEKLKKILSEMFQFDQSDLDFGIYRIMNQKREEIENFMNKELFIKIEKYIEPLKNSTSVDKVEKINKQLEALISLNEDGTLTEKINKLIKERENYKVVNINKIENEIYSYLSEFFRRYYDEGDFISQRRYKEGVYAVPYEGEEVKFYWANFDQYYVKSSEYFKDYIFQDKYNHKIHFKLIDAKIEKDNNKSKEKRTFQIITDIEKINMTFDEKDKIITNPQILDGELVIYFMYTDDEISQKKRNEETYKYLVDKINENNWNDFINLVDKKRKTDKSVFEYQLNRYTARNTYDYFIHKNLKKFLIRELDFYIKNEVLHLEDMDSENIDKLREYIIKAKVIENIAKVIIEFLSQLEEFQKKLWLKKKFIIETDYIITLDKVDERFYKDIINNKAQIEEWKKLFAIEDLLEEEENITEKFLKNNQYLMIDTKFYSKELKDMIIESIDKIDDETNGILINSDNFHALNLLQEKYREKVDCVYIDPPYNTSSSPIMYKNNYKDSSWLSLMNDRNEQSYLLANDKALFINAIDEAEYQNLIHLNNKIYGKNNYIGTITVKCNPQGRVSNKVNQTSEFNIIFAKNIENIGVLSTDKLDNYNEKTPFKRTGTNSRREDRPLRFYPMLIKNEKVYMIEDSEYSNIYIKNLSFDDNYLEELKRKYEKQGYSFVLPMKEDGTLLVWQREFLRAKKEYNTYIVSDGNIYTPGFAKEIPKTLWESSKFANPEYGTECVKHILMNTAENDVAKNTPKSFHTVEQMINLNNPNLVLDYFAGSGTTGHAVINLNRKDENNIKYILVEMGEYFNTVTKPRLEKNIYSKIWKNGKPVDREGISQIIKYMTLESYEDALNNIVFSSKNIFSLLPENSELKQEFLLSYMLFKETEDSKCMLNIDLLKNPFDYRMKIAKNNEIGERTIDLVETFNYLIGFSVIKNYSIQRYDAEFKVDFYEKEIAQLKLGEKYNFKLIEGILSNGDFALIIWRNISTDIKKDNLVLNAFIETKKEELSNFSYDVIYVNGDNFIKNINFCKNLKVKLIEEEMKKKMFEGVK